MTTQHPAADSIVRWFNETARELPWREARDPWGVLVSEVMGQQTPMSRVVPRWHDWMQRWPDPAALAAAATPDVLRAWERLGYPRRALNLQRAAQQIVERHGGVVPARAEDLLALPGVGPYTASAVMAFAFRVRTPVLDTNVRRVLARLHGEERPGPSITRGEQDRAAAALPDEPETSAIWNEGLMELGATICTPRPRCVTDPELCPLAAHCEWRSQGYPASEQPRRRTQGWHGTDRQARGRILAHLRSVDVTWVRTAEIFARFPSSVSDAAQAQRALASLAADGLITIQDLPEGEVARLGS